MRVSTDPVVSHDLGGLTGVGMGIADYGAWIAIGVVMLALAGLARWSMTPTRRVDPADEQRPDDGTEIAPPTAEEQTPPPHVRVRPTRRYVGPRGRTRRDGARGAGHDHLHGHHGAGPARRRPGRPRRR